MKGGFMIFGWFPWFFKVVSWFFMVFGWFPWFFMVPGWFFMVFLQNVTAPNCILARRSSLGPLPGVDQKILMTLPTPPSPFPPFSILECHWRSSGYLLSHINCLFVFLSFCFSVFSSFSHSKSLIIHLSSS